MHKESGFGTTLASRVDARGLMQMMPSLGQEMAGKARLPFFVPEDLFRPEVNIRLGTRRLGELSQMFASQLFLVAGGYNGGHLAVERWLEKHGSRPLDEFLELVGFRESREYMKRVTAIHARYTYLYTGKPPGLSLAIKLPKKPAARPAPTRKAPRRPAAEGGPSRRPRNRPTTCDLRLQAPSRLRRQLPRAGPRGRGIPGGIRPEATSPPRQSAAGSPCTRARRRLPRGAGPAR